jgi:enoyl-CoA hydratase/carnithine racemase
MKKSVNRIKTNVSFIKINKSSNNQYDSNKGNVIYKEVTEFVTEILLDNPNSLNSMTLNMVKIILASCGNWLSISDRELVSGIKLDTKFASKIPKVVIMAGSGERSFCAGGDVVSLYYAMKEKIDLSIVRDFFK